MITLFVQLQTPQGGIRPITFHNTLYALSSLCKLAKLMSVVPQPLSPCPSVVLKLLLPGRPDTTRSLLISLNVSRGTVLLHNASRKLSGSVSLLNPDNDCVDSGRVGDEGGR